MYDLTLLSTYFLLAFGVVLLTFPEYIQKISPENSYIQQIIENKEKFGVISIAVSVFLYIYQQKSCDVIPQLSSSPPPTISSTSSMISQSNTQTPTL